MLDDFRLRVFMMVAQENSFTRAAQHLGVSQPAVSQNIAELEKQVGAALFERRRGEVALTAEGYVFKEYAAKILHWYEATDALFGSAGKMTVNRPVRIATTSFAATHLLPDLLRDLLAVTATAGPDLPEEPRYAVWTPYRPFVDQDMYARSFLVSDSIPTLVDLIKTNENLVGVLPSQAAAGLIIHPDPLPHLQQDLHLRVSDAFSRTGIAQWLSTRFA